MGIKINQPDFFRVIKNEIKALRVNSINYQKTSFISGFPHVINHHFMSDRAIQTTLAQSPLS